MTQTTEEVIKNIDPKLIYKLLNEIGQSECPNKNCTKCRLNFKLKDIVKSLDHDQNIYLILSKTLKPSTLFLIGFLTALSYLEIKELEELRNK